MSAQAQRVINDADRVTLHGNTHPLARAEFDRGSADAAMPMNHMIMLLSVRPTAQAELTQLLADQQNPQSPNFHKWLTPAEFGLRFGPTDQDIADASNWLKRFGFKIDEVANGRMWINFSGDVQKVERAFQTNIRQFEVDGKIHHANASDPTIPRALTGLVRGVVSLHDFEKRHNSTVSQLPPDFNAGGGGHFLAPGDVSIIYNAFPLYNQAPAIDGSGQSVAIVGRTDINLADVRFFRSFFGLPPKDPIFIVNGADPGNLGGGEETEADLDVEWSGAIAKNATINFVVSQTTATTDGVDLSAQYIVNNNVAPIMSTSFGACEFALQAAGNAFWNALWAQAAAQGITAFVSAGDSGAAGCDDPNLVNVGTQQGVNGLASTPNNIAVGGTEFNEGAGNFWNASNSPVDQSSALGYIPENVWNESGNVAGGSGIFATGGGPSGVYGKPVWQTGIGVPGDGHRDIPDVSLSAAVHDAYLVIQGHTAANSGLEAVGGTSASSPTFASIMALVLQKTAAAQGNANPVFYSMAANQFNGGLGIFHDVTSGDNGVPGVPGFTAQAGYDLSSGWGSPDISNLVNFWNNNAGVPDFTINASPTSRFVTQNASTTFTFTVVPVNGYTGTVAFSVSGLPVGATASFAPASVTTSGSTVMTVTTAATTPLGTYPLTVTGSDGTIGHTSHITLSVANPDFSLSVTPTSQSVIQGNSISYTVAQTALNGYVGTVSFSVSGLPAGATPTFTPASVTTSGNTVLAIATTASTAAGTYSITITGTDGIITHTASATFIVLPLDFTLAASPASQTVNQGNSVSYTVTQTALNGYAGVVTLSATGLPTGATATFTPATITGSGTSSLTIATTATTPLGSYTLTITGTDGTRTHSATVTLVVSNPDFSLSATPSSQTINQGSPTSYSVTLNPISGYSGTVSFSVSGAPAGVTSSFSPISLTGSGSTTLNIATAFSTTPGTYTLTITGTDGTLTHTTQVTLVITPFGDFSMTASIPSQTVLPGQNTGYGISITSIGGFSSVVSLTVSGTPAGATATLNPASITGAGNTSLAVTTSVATPPGVYNLVVTGTSGPVVHSVTLQLIVNPATPGDFTLAAPASITVKRNKSGAETVTVAAQNGFTGNVSLGQTGTPSGVTATLAPSTVNGGSGSSTLTFTVANNAKQGTYPITVTGTSGNLVHSISVTLTVN
ncbi:MAG: protease pro-enzyme activation domain-containing protein [Candidatus Angelobacter sp.]